MVATRDTDRAISKFYMELGFVDRSSGKEINAYLNGLVKDWYMTGYNADYSFWDVRPE